MTLNLTVECIGREPPHGVALLSSFGMTITKDFTFQSYDEFISEYQRITGNSQKTGYQEAPYGYDSVWAIANMLNRSMNILQQNGKKYTSFTFSNQIP